MPNFSDLRPIVTAFAPNVPEFVASNAIRESARRFFRETHAYSVDVPIVLCQGVNTYELEVFENNLEVVAIKSAEFNEFDQMHIVAYPDKYENEGKPTKLMGASKRSVKVYPTPDGEYEITVKVAVRPSFDATFIDDDAYSENEEAIRYGALMTLKSQNATEWFSPEEVPYYGDLYRSEVNQKKIDIFNSYADLQPQHNIPKFI